MLGKPLAKNSFLGLVLCATLGCAAKPLPAPRRPGGRASAGASRVPSLVRERRSGPLRHRSDSGDGLFSAIPGRRREECSRTTSNAAPSPLPSRSTTPTEAVRWDHPPPGRYRVGVDFIDRCGSKTEEASFRVVIDGGEVGRNGSGRFTGADSSRSSSSLTCLRNRTTSRVSR